MRSLAYRSNVSDQLASSLTDSLHGGSEEGGHEKDSGPWRGKLDTVADVTSREEQELRLYQETAEKLTKQERIEFSLCFQGGDRLLSSRILASRVQRFRTPTSLL